MPRQTSATIRSKPARITPPAAERPRSSSTVSILDQPSADSRSRIAYCSALLSPGCAKPGRARIAAHRGSPYAPGDAARSSQDSWRTSLVSGAQRSCGHSMIRCQPDCRPSRSAASAGCQAQQLPQMAGGKLVSARRPHGRTSKLAVPATGLRLHHRNCSGKHHRPSSQSPRGCERAGRTTDATRTEPAVLRSCGRSLVLLYNQVRPHSSLGYLTPAAFAAKRAEQNAAPAQATGVAVSS